MITVRCSCGAKYEAKESSVGKQFACQKCGGMLAVAELRSDEGYGLSSDELAPRDAPLKSPDVKSSAPVETASSSQPKRKKKKTGRASTRESSGFNWTSIFTGDIRPLLLLIVGTLLGIGFIVFPFVYTFDPKDFVQEPGTVVRAQERVGAGVIVGIFALFGRTGVTIFCVLFGLFILALSVWTIRNVNFESDD